MSLSSGAYLGSHSTVSQGRAASALLLSLLVWIGPLSSTITVGFATALGLGAQRRSNISKRVMKSVLRLVALVMTVNSLLAASSTPSIARFLAWPGASIRISVPRLAQT